MSGFGTAPQIRAGGVGCGHKAYSRHPTPHTPRLIALTPSPCFLEDRPDFLQIDTRKWFG